MITLLNKCIDNPKDISDDEFKRLKTSYGQCNNNAKCPCSSGKTYNDCCKSLWRAASRSYENRNKEVKERKKAENDLHYVCQVAVDGLGRPRVVPMPGQKLNTFEIEDIFSVCLREIKNHNIYQTIRQTIKEFLNGKE